MTIKRKLARIETPPAEPGFLGAGHIARPVIYGDFANSDPFIVLMDDMLDKKDNSPAGGPHPHAGFETVTLILEGEMGEMKKGGLQIMTAGSGVVHTETIDKPMKMRILQLWVSLPKKDRWTTPRLQDLPPERVPQKSEYGMNIKVYSGSLAGLTSPLENYSPFILADISLEAGSATTLQLPAGYNTMLYPIEGSVEVGEDKKLLKTDQSGWLDIHNAPGMSELQLSAGAGNTRLILYAGQPTGDNIVAHGPFIADTPQDITRLFYDYRAGRMPHIDTVPEEQRIML
ncbi:pirin family protein [Polluticoccus soli]|uniref:pirin family protein n=1 Tax=Polluticoccus soli TaxID=3034150 RepID=UPI0023E22E82|nr:pirin-like C-terminal cupin domain-containing protein [Flavipsychrobacter sp. JY13-12]